MANMSRFRDRIDAGRRLAAKLQEIDLDEMRSMPVTVLGLPRGGVPVAAEVAASLGAPLDVILVRKLGVPTQPELAMGAIGEDGVVIVNDEVMGIARVSDDEVASVVALEQAELERRAERYRQGRPRLDLRGRIALVVDDGMATGSTARAACRVARAHGASRVVLAVPVAPAEAEHRMAGEADIFVAVRTPSDFHAVGQFYERFTQTTDDEVVQILEAAVSQPARMPPQRPAPPVLE